MLAKRIATALTLAPLVILGVLYLSPSWFSLVIGIMTCIASWEYCKLIKLSGFSNRAFYITVLLACAFLLAISPLILKPTLYLVTIWWLAALFVVVGFPNNSKLINKIIVSTDNEENVISAESFGAVCPFLRPPELSEDWVSLEQVQQYNLA